MLPGPGERRDIRDRILLREIGCFGKPAFQHVEQSNGLPGEVLDGNGSLLRRAPREEVVAQRAKAREARAERTPKEEK